MKKLLLLLVLVPIVNSYGQSGYLGALNGVSIEFNAVPSFRVTNRYFEDTVANERFSTQRLRYSWFTFGVAYSRIFTKTFELSTSYNFTKARSPVIRAGYGTENNNYLEFLEDPQVNMHILTLKGRFYRKGSIAPIGKYIGVGFKFGFARWNTEDEFYAGQKGSVTKDNFFLTKYEVNSATKYEPRLHDGSFFQLNAEIGRNYPITDFLMIGVNMTFPVMGVYSSNGWNRIGPFINNEKGTYEYDQWYQLTQLTMRKLSGLTGHICFKFLI